MAYEHLNRSGVVWLIAKIKSALSDKVDKVEGKGLSTNDLTAALKTSYDGAVTDVAALKKVGAEKNTIVSVSVNGTAVTADAKRNVNLTIPTNDQIQSAINEALSGITGIDIQVVQSLPSTGVKGVIYLVAHTHSDAGDVYDEYVWVSSQNKFEKIGNTDVDLSGYIKTDDLVDINETTVAALWNA